MDRRKREICYCPKELRKLCKRNIKFGKPGARGSLRDLVAALQYEEDVRRKAKAMKKMSQSQSKPKVYKPLKIKEKMVPMYPPMDKRLKYLLHCDEMPYVKTFEKRPRIRYHEESSGEDDDLAKKQKKEADVKQMKEEKRCRMEMASGQKAVKHTESDTSIIHVPSPRVSGININAKPAVARPAERKPPLAPKSAYELYKPHSGIVLNQDKDYAVEGLAGVGKVARKPRRRKCPPCAKGGVCMRKKCKRKKCRKYAAMRRRQMARAARNGKGMKKCSALKMKGLARDGKPRARHTKGNVGGIDDTGCGLDDIERPDFPVIQEGLKHGSFRTHSLTVIPCNKEKKKAQVHFGILMGSCNMFNEKFGKSRGRQALTMCIMAYCLAFHYHPKQWNTKLVDKLMQAADQWYLELLEKVHDHSAVQGMCEVVPYGKRKVLILNKKRMQVLLGEPEIVGYTMSLDPTVYNLCRGIKAFFCGKDQRGCIFMTRSVKLVIWRDKVCYNIFDPAGRDAKACSNFAQGNAALINVMDQESVIDILLSRTIVDDQKYVLAPIKVLAMVNQSSEDDLESDPEPTTAEKAKMSYKILTQNQAIVNANIHLGDRSFDDAKFQQALTIAVVALAYAKISPPNTWYTKTLDKIIKLGTKLYTDCKNPKITFELGIDNIPSQIVMGPYSVEIIIYRDRTKGQLFTTKECILNITTGLSDFFNDHNSGILDFSNYKLAIWKQKDMYYVFDPYPRTNDGERTMKGGKACCMMLLNTEAMAEALTKNWDFLPATTPFYIHAFKVLKLSNMRAKNDLTVSLSKTRRRSRSRSVGRKRSELKAARGGSRSRKSSKSRLAGGDSQEVVTVMAALGGKEMDEEYMGEIVSLVDSIADDFVPPVPMKFRNMVDDPPPPKVMDLDSPTVSVTQILPPWPKPRDKTNEPPEPDPDPEPSPPPTPPPPVPPEGPVEEAEEEELDEEAMKRKLEEELRRKMEEEEARRRAEMLPPPMPPPPPTPQIDEEPKPLRRRKGGRGGGGASGAGGGDEDGGGGGGGGAGGGGAGGGGGAAGGGGGPDDVDDDGEEISLQEDDALLETVEVERYVLLPEDAKKRYKMRQARRKMTNPLEEGADEADDAMDAGAVCRPSKERLGLPKPALSNFTPLPDKAEIIQGSNCIADKDAINILPFVAIMSVVTSYKYAIQTWTKSIVDFVIDTGNKLYAKKLTKFQAAPLHIIPKISIGDQAFHVSIDVVGEGPTWQLEDVLARKFFPKHDRGILTTPFYSCGLFRKGGYFYLFDGSECDAMGLRRGGGDGKKSSGKGRGCFLRFTNIRDLSNRIQFNKNGRTEDSQFILSKVVVRRLLPQIRYKLPESYDYELMQPKDKKAKRTPAEAPAKGKAGAKESEKGIEEQGEPKMILYGYQEFPDGVHRINGSTALPPETKKIGDIGPDHFVGLVAMLMATMHPFREWTSSMVDCCLETGLEICSKATNLTICEKRVIKNIILDGKFIDVNVKKIIVINDNPEKYLEQYMKAVLGRLRYVMVRFPGCNLVIVQSNGFFHVFDPYAPPKDEAVEPPVPKPEEPRKLSSETEEEFKKRQEEKKKQQESQKPAKLPPMGGWQLYRTLDGVINRVKASFFNRKGIIKEKINSPEFYTFELTSVRPAPRHAMFNFKLSPLFRPDENPNQPYLKQRRPRTIVDEKMYWLNIDCVPWSRSLPNNDLGMPRNTPATRWKAWDIEFPGDLLSLWGSTHLSDEAFPEERRGKQYLAGCVLACVMTHACSSLAAWTSSLIDGILVAADKFHGVVADKYRNTRNHEMCLEDYQGVNGEMYPYKFTAKFNLVILGFVYNLHPDRFNLSKALSYFFEKQTLGILISPSKNLAFGKVGTSYFLFDCQSSGEPLFNRAAYMLKCESLNRLIYCMTITLNLRRHNQQFHLYSVQVSVQETNPAPTAKKDTPPASSKVSEASSKTSTKATKTKK